MFYILKCIQHIHINCRHTLHSILLESSSFSVSYKISPRQDVETLTSFLQTGSFHPHIQHFGSHPHIRVTCKNTDTLSSVPPPFSFTLAKILQFLTHLLHLGASGLIQKLVRCDTLLSFPGVVIKYIACICDNYT